MAKLKVTIVFDLDGSGGMPFVELFDDAGVPVYRECWQQREGMREMYSMETDYSNPLPIYFMPRSVRVRLFSTLRKLVGGGE